MQYKQETEKVAMMDRSYMVVPKPLSLAEDREVQRTRKVLIIILRVCLGLSVTFLVVALCRSDLTTEIKVTPEMVQTSGAIIAILFYGFGISVARRYSAIGLRVFAWLNIIPLVLTGIGIVLLLLAMIICVTVINHAVDENDPIRGFLAGVTAGIFIINIICIPAFILLVMSVKFAFKLARVIDANQRLIIQKA